MDPTRRTSHPIPLSQYRRAFAYVAPYWRGILLVLLLGLFSTAVSLLQPYMSRLLIDGALLRHDRAALWRVALAMLLVTLAGLGVNAASNYTYTRLSAASLFAMRLDVFRHLQTLSPRFFAHRKLGDIVSRINNDIGEVQRVCSDTLLSVVSNVLFLFGSLTVMVWMNLKLTLVSLCLLPISIIALQYYQRRLTAHTAKLRQRSSDLGSFLIESILGIRLTVCSASEEYEINRFGLHNQRFVQALLSMQMVSFLASALPGTVLTLATAAVFLFGGKLVIDGSLTVGAFVAFMAYHVRLLSPVQGLLGVYASLVTGGVSLGRVFEILDVAAEVVEPIHPAPLATFSEDLRLTGVSFSYLENKPVLVDVSLTLPKGSFTALMGPSGVGKSTIADLILRLYDPVAGTIAIDGRDIRGIALKDLRTQIGVVEQTPYMFHASVRENIAYGHPDASMDDILRCAQQAAAHAFIATLPNGYDTVIGERGATLSVGERQRIALARALLRNPSILILDEPTSALDTETEAMITETLAENLRGKTVLVITHRPAMAKMADTIYLLESGRIREVPRKAPETKMLDELLVEAWQ